MHDCQRTLLLVVIKLSGYQIVTGRQLALQKVFQSMMFQLLDGAPGVCGNQNTLMRAFSTELYMLIQTRETLFYLIVCFLSELTLCRLFSARENILNMMEKQKLVSDKYAQQMTQSYLKLHFSAERSCSLQGMTMMMTSRII